MDNTLVYCILAGVGLVFLFAAAKFALRWLIRLSIIGVILAVLAGAVWVWVNYHSSPSPAPSRPVRRAGS